MVTLMAFSANSENHSTLLDSSENKKVYLLQLLYSSVTQTDQSSEIKTGIHNNHFTFNTQHFL